MNKNDFRIQLPLWNIGAYSILILWAVVMSYILENKESIFEQIFVSNGGETTINLLVPTFILYGFLLFLCFLYIVIYIYKVRQYNRQKGTTEISTFSVLVLNELVEEDEMLKQVSERTTKKLYVINTIALVCLMFVIVMFALPHVYYAILILLLLIFNNAFYYYQITCFLDGKYKEEIKVDTRKLDKWFLIIFISCLIIAFSVISYKYYSINKNSSDVSEEFKACVDQGKTATLYIEKTGFNRVECR